MSKIFDGDSDSEINVRIKTDNEYAKNYDVWRKKEEFNKLKTKYGEENLNLDDENSSSSSDDDEDGIELTEKVEKDFFKTLAALKNKDPKIYDEHITFFDKDNNDEPNIKKKNGHPVFIKDYERKLLLEKGGVVSDHEEVIDIRSSSPTFVEEQRLLKEQIKKGLDKLEDGDVGISERKKTKEEKESEEAGYKKWLGGQAENVDEQIESELKPLKDYWNNPRLDKEEKFLRDYILNKKFLEKDDEDYIPTYDEIIHDSDDNLSHDEEEIEKQEEFEHKFNFRFEDPDQEFIKRYPRTLESSLRKKDDRRKTKRAETKERKKKEKDEKFADLRKLQELKQKEIEEKIEKLKEITGNADVDFKVDDVDGDFDPEAHDKRMQALFNDEFYEEQAEEQKPIFPEIDEELEIENWDQWSGNEDSTGMSQETHCEDEDFNMDADYNNPSELSVQDELIENSKGKKKRRRKSKFAQALATPKPKYDPYDKNYEKYFEEYYKLDCEDIIGDIPCRFKYREVLPNDFGLTIEEILLAKDRELNKWCSLKKSVQRRPEHIEKYEQKVYAQKANNWELKKKILPSLFTPDPEKVASTTQGINHQVSSQENDSTSGKNNKKKNRKNTVNNITEKSDISTNIGYNNSESTIDNVEVSGQQKVKKQKNSKSISNKNINASSSNEPTKNGKDEPTTEKTNSELEANHNNNNDINQKISKKKKKKKAKNMNTENNSNEQHNKKRKLQISPEETPNKKKFKKNNGQSMDATKRNAKQNKNKRGPKNKTDSVNIDLTDARLVAYGIKPKKFKNKLKYGNK